MTKTSNEVLNANLTNLIASFEEYKTDSKKSIAIITEKLDNQIVAQATIKTRTDNMAVFQSIFSIIIGAIATYLGVSSKH
jgi:hypothetical protein